MRKCLAFAYLQQKRICENFLAVLSKVHLSLSCPQQHFKKTIFLISCFFSFWVFECKINALWQNKLIEIVKTLFTVIARFFMQKCFSSVIWNIFVTPELWGEFSEPFRGKKQEWLSKQNSTCPEHQFCC